MPVRVLKSSENYLVIYKPEGIPFHAVGAKDGILQVVRKMEEQKKIPPGDRLYPVHRLDMVTSGILVFARGRKAANELGNEFRFSRVEKYYLALSDRPPKKKQGTVIGDMTKGRGGAWILTRDKRNPAVTHFLSRSIPGRRSGLRLFVLKPKTGRTHQIRVAMKSLGSPILGDPLYSRFDLARAEERTYLHAYAIRFKLGEETVTVTEPPESGAEFQTDAFQQVLRSVHDPFRLQFPGNRPSLKK